ncbi:MAG: spermidine synthase [Gammaproteobacteria bacterium]|nr:spermidine synthase [Gammaproteobacteria bacterium]
MPVQQHQSKGFMFYILLTAVLCGALIMVIEVMGSRVIGPFFGVSLFVWTSLITVALVALALGYAVGGYFSDRFGEPKYLYIIICIAGTLTLLVPVLQSPVLKLTVPMGLRGGAFASTFVLFGPALFLLGWVSPFLVKIAAYQMKNLGRVVGGLYALSTIGSTIGTVLTGFVLVAFFGVDRIFLITGMLLITLSVGYFLFFERRWWAAIALLLPFALYHPSVFENKILADGTELSKVYSSESYYGSLKVVDSVSPEKHSRYMMIDSMVQGGMDMNNGLSIYMYNYYLQFIPYMLNPGGDQCLVIGLGIGMVPRWYEEQGAVCDVIDIDPDVITIAQDYFNFKNKGEAITEDGRYFIATTEKQYDYLILDVFNGDITPSHLLSLEALQMQQKRLAPGGVFAANLIGSLVENNFMTASIIRTMEAVFDQVEIYPIFKIEETSGIGNIIVVAYQGEPRKFQQTDRDIYTIHPFFEQKVKSNLGARYYFPPGTKTMLLTDNYNPVDFYDHWLRELIRQNILDTIDWDLLIG